jgi:hypothetical protein
MYEIYRHLAERLGLHLSPPDPGMMTFVIELSGSVDGHPVRLQRFCGKGAWIRVSAPLVRHMDLGLGVAPSSILSTISEWLGGQDIQVEDAEFDRQFGIRGDEPSRVKVLLNPALRADLGSAGAKARRLTDAETWLELATEVEAVDTLEGALHSVVATARGVEEARLAVPPAAALQAYYERWQIDALERGWRVEATPLGASRTDEPIFLAQGLRLGANEHAIELYLGAADIPFRIEPRRALVPRLLGSASVPTGDPVFDDAFELRRVPPEHVATLFTTDIRDRLLATRKWGELVFDAIGIKLHAPLKTFAPEDLRHALDALVALRSKLREAASALT